MFWQGRLFLENPIIMYIEDQLEALFRK